MSVLPKLIYISIFNAIEIKIPPYFFVEMDELAHQVTIINNPFNNNFYTS